MSERIFRLILGVSLLLFLLMQWQMAIYGYIVLLMFEGVTNWRIPILVSKLRYGDKFQEYVEDSSSDAKVQFDAERVLRFVVGIFVVISFILLPDLLWFFPWFVGFMLMMAGITNICPMVMFLRWVGFR